MACYIRAYGSQFDVDAFVDASLIEWNDVWRAGEAKDLTPPDSSPAYVHSGLQMEIGEGDQFASLLDEASEFLRTNRAELLRLSAAPGLERLEIDFGLTWDPKMAVVTVTIPADFVVIAAEVRLAIEVTYYDL